MLRSKYHPLSPSSSLGNYSICFLVSSNRLSSSSAASSSFKAKFWGPVNDQKQRTGMENVKEAAQKFQMVGHVQKLMVLSATSASPAVPVDTTTKPTFSWTGIQTNHPQVVEDFLIFLACGFDIKSVDCVNDVFVLEHCRNFLGWKPAPAVISSSSSPPGSDNENPNILRIPFSMTFELREVVPSLSRPSENDSSSADDAVVDTETKFSHVTFDCPLVDVLRYNTKCPHEIVSCLDEGGREPVKMVVALRKAGVRPEIISWRALKSATKKTSTWASALGVL